MSISLGSDCSLYIVTIALGEKSLCLLILVSLSEYALSVLLCLPPQLVAHNKIMFLSMLIALLIDQKVHGK